MRLSKGRGALSKLALKIGTLIGQTKRKEPELVDMWLNLCHSMGKKPTERFLELIAWDVENQGVDLKDIRQIEQDKEMQKAFSQVNLAAQIAQLAQEFSTQMLTREWQHAQEMQQLIEMLKAKQLKELEIPQSVKKAMESEGEEDKPKWRWEKTR